MNFLTTKVNYSNNHYTYPKPNVCPHCGTTIDAAVKVLVWDRSVVVLLFTCTYAECKKYFYATYGYPEPEIGLVYRAIHPFPMLEDVPQRLVDASGAFGRKCREAFAAEVNEHLELAACGYRNAMEALAKDYAVKYCGCDLPPQQLRRLTLDKCIRDYLTDLDSTVSAFFAKEEGNRATHYPEIEGEEFNFDEFKAYFNLFLQSIDHKIKIQEMAQKLPDRHKHKFDSPSQPPSQPSEENQ